MEILRVEDLVKTYGKGENQVNAVDHISFSIEKGEFVAIIGASGSGKSTFLKTMGICVVFAQTICTCNAGQFSAWPTGPGCVGCPAMVYMDKRMLM